MTGLHRVKPDYLYPGHQLDEDLFSSELELVAPKGLVLNEYIIARLNEVKDGILLTASSHLGEIASPEPSIEDHYIGRMHRSLLEGAFERVEMKPIIALDEHSAMKEGLSILFAKVRNGEIEPFNGVRELPERVIDYAVRHRNIGYLPSPDSPEDYHLNHSVNVAILLVVLVHDLVNDPRLLNEYTLSALLHNIGMHLLPQEILSKQTALIEDEWKQVRDHPVKSAELLKEMGVTEGEISDVVLCHHERQDGKGYPRGVRGDKVPFFASILHVADLYDALISEVPYRAALRPYQAASLILREGDSRVGGAVRKLCIKRIGIYPLGTLVKLSNGEFGIVTQHNERDILTPTVKIILGRDLKEKLFPPEIHLADCRSLGIVKAI